MLLKSQEKLGSCPSTKSKVSGINSLIFDNCFKTLPRQALHAKTLGFEHPITKEFLRFDTPIPQDLQDCIEKWRIYSKAQTFTEET
jgi:hypothetical protein